MPVNISASFFFSEINKLILQLIWKYKQSRIAKIILEKNEVGTYNLPILPSGIQLVMNAECVGIRTEICTKGTELGTQKQTIMYLWPQLIYNKFVTQICDQDNLMKTG